MNIEIQEIAVRELVKACIRIKHFQVLIALAVIGCMVYILKSSANDEERVPLYG